MISVIVATYGPRGYWDMIAERAVRSAELETDDVIRIHGNTLAEARNEGAAKAKNKRLVFLDADDELARGFNHWVVEYETVLQPRTQYFHADYTVSEPYWIAPRESLYEGNHIIVGAPVLKEAFMDVGGFDDYPIYEDWALWLKMKQAGATFGKTWATYRVHVNPKGRNSQNNYGWVYEQIRQDFRG